MSSKFTRYLAVLLFFGICLCSFAQATNIEGTTTYQDYIFVLIHGMGASEGHFTGKTPYGNLKKYLEDNLDLKGRVFAYTFNNPNGSNYTAARELGDRSYSNTAVSMNSESWLEKAREEFRDYGKHPENRGKLVPSKYILITHSMGNFAARAYIYSDKVFGKGKGFYQNDVDKVVFIAPPLLGSDNVLAMMAFWANFGKQGYEKVRQLIEDQKKMMVMEPEKEGTFKVDNFKYEADWKDLWAAWKSPTSFDVGKAWQIIQKFLMQLPGDNPFLAYYAAVYLAGADIFGPQVVKKNGFGYATVKPWTPGMLDLLPVDAPSIDNIFGIKYTNLASKLRGVQLDDSSKEPDYSIVYARGIPVADWQKSVTMIGIKAYDSYFKQESFIPSLDYWMLSLPFLGQFPTSQGKMLSLTSELMLNSGFMTNDGDGLVPSYSARGDGIKSLKNARRYAHIFKTDRFENYLNGQFVQEVTVTETAIATTAFFISLSGTPYPVAWRNLWWMRIPAALSLLDKVHYNINGLRSDIEAHGRILQQYDLIKTAILDSYALATVTDFQTNVSSESLVSQKVQTFSVSSPEAGYHSIGVKAFNEQRTYKGNYNMAVPTTLDGKRRYLTSVTVFEAPKKITGKLNYLIPKLMQKFEYSFNFSSWQPIKNVDPQTGEFVIENLPFAEGQNLLSVRSINAVGIQSNQLLKITLNTIPLLSSELTPLPGTYINNNQPVLSGLFSKAAYSKSKLEWIKIKRAKLICGSSEVDVTSELKTTQGGSTYNRNLSFSYCPKSPLKDGEYSLVVVADSNVGVAQAIINVTVDTQEPILSTEKLKPYSPRPPNIDPLTIKFTVSDEASPVLKSATCQLYSSQNKFITTIATRETLTKGENFFSYAGTVADGEYFLKITTSDLADNLASQTSILTVDATAPKIIKASLDQNPVTQENQSFSLVTNISEQSMVFITLENLTTNKVLTYISQSNTPYTFHYDQAFSSGPEDGKYRIKVQAHDEAGNLSSVYTLEGVTIDRTPPKIYDQIANPYVLGNDGKTTLSYYLSDAKSVKVKVYNTQTGKLVSIINPAPAANGSENKVSWTALGAGFPQGAYRFQIIATDSVGNTAMAYSSCVKGGMAPEISQKPLLNKGKHDIIK